MKRAFWFLAILTIVFPTFADPVAGTPEHADSVVIAQDSNDDTIQPGYALVETDADIDENMATAGYVKGAYNAAIKAVNTVADSIPMAEPAPSAAGRAPIWVE